MPLEWTPSLHIHTVWKYTWLKGSLLSFSLLNISQRSFISSSARKKCWSIFGPKADNGSSGRQGNSYLPRTLSSKMKQPCIKRLDHSSKQRGKQQQNGACWTPQSRWENETGESFQSAANSLVLQSLFIKQCTLSSISTSAAFLTLLQGKQTKQSCALQTVNHSRTSPA